MEFLLFLRYYARSGRCLRMDSIRVMVQMSLRHWLPNTLAVFLLPVRAERDGSTKWSSGRE